MASIVVRQHRRPPPAPTILAGIAFVLVAAGCDDGMGPRLEPGNVDVLLNAVVEETDTAVIVNGTPMIRYPSHDAALWIGRTESFDFGGFPEHGLPDSGRRALYWTLMLTHEYPRVVKGDSLIFRFVDHGDAAVEGNPMTKLTDLPSFTPGAPLRFINFVRYLTTPFHHVEWADGGATTFEDAAYFDDLVAGATLTVETTGSGEATPVSATFSAGPAPALTAVENGDPVDLEGFTLPVVDPAENLALSFDASLDPARSFLLLIPIDRSAFPGARPAFIQPRSTTTRVVIPGGILGELRSPTAAGPVPFVLLVVDITVEEGVLSGTLLEDQSSFSLPRVQQGATSMYLYVK